jgi:hypothetical protein
MDSTLHEIHARRNALVQLLINSQGAAITHLEHVVGAILLAMDAQSVADMQTQLTAIETLDPATEAVVKLYGETTPDITIKSQRELWAAELSDLESQIEAAYANSCAQPTA